MTAVQETIALGREGLGSGLRIDLKIVMGHE